MCGETFPDSTTFCPRDGSALRAAVHGDDLIGELFCDRYVVTDLLGEGGMGAVYLARDVRLPQQVAIKVLRDKTAADPITISRFRQEAEAASRINHDRVARVSDFGFMTDGRAYLIMEYVSGRTLKQTLEERGPLPPAEAAHITSMVAEGLDAAHRLGIVHRDLKPENVMIVDDAGGGTRVKVLDFGIAKVLQDEGTAGRTAPGFVIGSPPWMSPEQILGETLDARSDVFALGLLAYAMLTGQRAFAGTSEQAEMMARLTSFPRPLEDALPGVVWPVGLQALLHRTLSREVNLRPAGALAFARELTKVIGEGMPAVATPTSIPIAEPQASRASTGGVRRLAIGGSITAALLLVAMIAVWQSRRGTKPADVPTANSQTVATDSAKLTAPMVGGRTPVATAAPGAAAVDSSSLRRDSLATRDTGAKAATAAQKPVAPRTVGAVTSLSVTNPSVKKLPATSKNPVVDGGQRDGVPNSAAQVAADELQRIMRDADADIGTDESNSKRARARDFIQKLETLSPKLTNAADQGWALLYIGMSQATLGENDKACVAIKRAISLSEQSRRLRANSEQWQQTLNCGK